MSLSGQLVSIIVPVYKVEKYLSKCIESIINQTYTNLEIILVDDGSPDNCGKICDEYSEIDNRIKAIHTKNSGVSVARNTGISNSNGEFIMFVDSDDELESNAVEVLIKKQKEHDFDMVLGSSIIFSRKGEVKPESINKQWFGEDVFCNIFKILSLFSGTAPWAKLYKKSIIVENNIAFMKNITYGEDAIFIAEYIEKITSIVIFDNVVYRYNCMNISCASEKLHEHTNEYTKIFIDVVKRIADKAFEENKEQFEDFVASRINLVLLHYLYRSNTVKAASESVKKTIEIFDSYIRMDLLEKEIGSKATAYL